MQWTADAEEAIKKVPFFVRKRVRARVENEARKEGKLTVRPADVKATQKRYLTGMASEIKGYQLDMCFGPSGCPNQIQASSALADEIVNVLQKADLISFLKSKGTEKLKFHHEFRVTLADCPNACSQPQIKDIGIIAAAVPRIGDEPCSGCNACVDACRESAISIDASPRPMVQQERCVACGQCVPACTTGTLVEGLKGYRVQLGGKLGRHPQLAVELPGIYDAASVLDIVSACIQLYKHKSRRSERFGELLHPADVQRLTEQFASRNLAGDSIRVFIPEEDDLRKA